MSKFWQLRFNPIRILFEAFFCTRKNGVDKKEFSSAKFFAFVLIVLSISDHALLQINPDKHWTEWLSKSGVHESVLISLIASRDALAAWALGVYKWSKAKGAA